MPSITRSISLTLIIAVLLLKSSLAPSQTLTAPDSVPHPALFLVGDSIINPTGGKAVGWGNVITPDFDSSRKIEMEQTNYHK